MTTTNKKRLFEFISLSLLLGLAAAIGTIVFFGSLTSACFYGAFAAIITARIKRRRARVLVWIVCTTTFVLIGLSRIYLGVHHTTDVIAGLAAALIWILVVRFVELTLRRRRRRKDSDLG